MNLYDLLERKKRNETLEKLKELPEGERIYAKMLLRAMVYRVQRYGIDYYYPYPKQKKFHCADAFFRIMWGSNSSGKTYAAVAEVCCHLSGIYPRWFPDECRYPEPVDAWIGLQDYESFEDTHKGYIENFIGPLKTGYNSKDHQMTFKTGTKLHVKSYKSGTEAFESSEVPFIYLDEEPSEDILQACRARIVRRDMGQIMSTITPVSGPQWFFKVLQKAKDKNDYYSIQVDMDDNKSLTEKDKREFREGIDDERERKVRVEGKAIPLIGQRIFQEEAIQGLREDVCEGTPAKLTWRDNPVDKEPYELSTMGDA